MLLRLENLPASSAGVSANDFFPSFKLACEAAGDTVVTHHIWYVLHAGG